MDNELIDLLINVNVVDYDPYDYLENPTFRFQTSEQMNANPEDPYVANFVEYAEYGWGNEGYIIWAIPNVNVNGFLLDTDNMYYHLLADGDVLTLTTDEYPEFDRDYTDIPWNFTDNYDLAKYGIKFEFTFKSADFKTFGCQSFYVGSDGVTYASNVVTYEPSGIESINADKAIDRVEFFDLQGRRVVNPGKGFYVVRYHYTDGTTSASKLVK